MADDGSIAPDERRLERAHRAGLRATSPWLMPAALCLGLGGALRWFGPAALAEWRARWVTSFVRGEVVGAGLGAALTGLLAGAAAIAVVVAVLAGGLGWVDERAGRGLGVGSLRSWSRGVLALVVPGMVLLVLAGVCAGAARAVDASEAGLWALWWAWAQRLLLGVGGLLLLVGVVDRALARRRLWRALHRDVGELRRGEA